MKRFTAPIPLFANQFYVDNKKLDYQIRESAGAINKLGQLEDIEEKWGIDLLTFDKLIESEKVYIFSNNGIIEADIEGINIVYKKVCVWNGTCSLFFKLNEYGKSFALTKEELL